ncbi:DUF423 domain-containing protein [Shewanella intestini]|uniref:DUF423 domain-containing protein n=1 Tax=Shewanella intestini TaxID=2017544 RepID=A0ABS5HZX0_9GAMM|nr:MULTISPECIES: DUF423 domain-containing protein [Shewanella]MBR9727327.1 DUF423 domain-containing protein [Shewanella intestini]MRG35623.1 DUF423 domain-containing protein [Shewanella sp. XMDDZSB0408]
MNKSIMFVAAISGFIAVALGAFGAHGLKTIAPEHLVNIFNLGVQYQFYHTFALVALSLSYQAMPVKQIVWAARCFVAGMVLFSGSLYLYAFTGVKWVGPITPIGGTALLVGWALFAYALYKSKAAQQ